MKKSIYRLVIAFFILVPVTAWTQEAVSMRMGPSGKKTVPPGVMDDAHLGLGIPFLQNTSEDLTMEVKALAEALAVMRQRQADQGADVSEIRDLIKAWSGKVEELLKGLSVAERKLNQINAKMSRMERSLSVRQGEHKSSEQNHADQLAGKGQETLSEPEAVYEKALSYFKEEKYEQAREEFQRIIADRSGTPLAVQAQFWIGECFYLDGNYEQALLEYEKVVKQYPKGEKAPQALLKEGMCFSQLGDNATAKLVFQQLVEHYPDSSQATTAAAKLAEMK